MTEKTMKKPAKITPVKKPVAKKPALKIVESPATKARAKSKKTGQTIIIGVAEVRRSPISWIRSDVADNRWIFERLAANITNINDQFFNYELTDIQSLQFTSYDAKEKGFYGKHIDMMYKGTGTRKLSVTIQLSDDKDYEGGDLLLHYKNEPDIGFRNLGTATFFPSWMLHEVTPVTKGKRYSLVAWIQGPRFK